MHVILLCPNAPGSEQGITSALYTVVLGNPILNVGVLTGKMQGTRWRLFIEQQEWGPGGACQRSQPHSRLCVLDSALSASHLSPLMEALLVLAGHVELSSDTQRKRGSLGLMQVRGDPPKMGVPPVETTGRSPHPNLHAPS